MHDLTIFVDSFFPLTPIWSYIYIGSFAYWTINYILISRDSPQMVYRIVAADMAAKAVCLLFFVFMPCTLEQPSLDNAGTGAWLLRIVYQMDRPVDLFPSIHCLVAWLSFRPLLNCKSVKPWYKVFSFIFSCMIFVSTLYTKQHVFVDVIAGFALAEISYDLAPRFGLMELLKKWNRRFDKETV